MVQSDGEATNARGDERTFAALLCEEWSLPLRYERTVRRHISCRAELLPLHRWLPDLRRQRNWNLETLPTVVLKIGRFIAAQRGAPKARRQAVSGFFCVWSISSPTCFPQRRKRLARPYISLLGFRKESRHRTLHMAE